MSRNQTKRSEPNPRTHKRGRPTAWYDPCTCRSDREAEARMDAEACDALVVQCASERGGATYPQLVEIAGGHGHGEDQVAASITRLIAAKRISHHVEDRVPVYFDMPTNGGGA